MEVNGEILKTSYNKMKLIFYESKVFLFELLNKILIHF